MNSYDLGVDIELNDAVQRLRFEYPNVKVVILKSGKDRVFCAGANIKMLGAASHADKVNFCKFTNETRNGIEDASDNSDQKYICLVFTALNFSFKIKSKENKNNKYVLPSLSLLEKNKSLLITKPGTKNIGSDFLEKILFFLSKSLKFQRKYSIF